MTAPPMMGFSRRNKFWLTGSLINTSLNLVLWMKKHKGRRPSARVARCESTFRSDPAGDCFTLAESLLTTAEAIPEECVTQHGLPVMLSLSQLDLKDKGQIPEVIHKIETGKKVPPTMRHELPGFATIPREQNSLELQDGVLYWRR